MQETTGGVTPGGRRERVLRVAGALVMGVSLLLIGAKLWETGRTLSTWRPSRTLLASILVASAGYAVLGLLLATAWHLLLRAFDAQPPSRRRSYRIYARTQLAKYVPGNVAQLASRHVMARRAGSDNGALVAAAFLEIAGLVLAAGTVALVGGAFFFSQSAPLAYLVIGAGAVLGIVAVIFGPRWSPLIQRALPRSSTSPRALVGSVAGACALYLLFFLAGGLLLLALVTSVAEARVGSRAAAALVAAFALSWAAGFLTPGAPAGIGVREAALVASLEDLVGASNILVAALALRLVTGAGDCWLFLGSFLYDARFPSRADDGGAGAAGAAEAECRPGVERP